MTDNFWIGKNVLITGITGFIGSNVAKFLIKSGANVFGVTHNSHNFPLIFDTSRCTFLKGDICDYQFITSVISSCEIDTIFHLAAYAIVRISSRDPLSTYRINVMGTANILEAARNVGKCKRIIVASSDKSYGDHEQLPYTENHALQPYNTYDTSKACMDMIARSYARNYNMPVCVTRSSNVYGPGDMNLSRIVPNSARLVNNGEQPVLYDDVHVMEREFIYVDDVVSAYDLLSRANPNVTCGEAFNIGGTGAVSVGNVAKMICTVMGRDDISPKIIPRGESTFREIQKQYINADKLTSVTGWKPSTNLEDGLRMTCAWYKHFFDERICK